jgi:hypothetical protein
MPPAISWPAALVQRYTVASLASSYLPALHPRHSPPLSSSAQASNVPGIPRTALTPTGGWWSRPTNWASNTAITVAGIAVATYSIWKLSARNEVSQEWGVGVEVFVRNLSSTSEPLFILDVVRAPC